MTIREAAAALREIAERDHFVGVTRMVPSHVPDAGKMGEPHV